VTKDGITGRSSLGEQQRAWACFFERPACRRVRRSSRLRSGSPPCGGVRPRRARSISATSGRLDGLLGGCDALLRGAIPGGAPHGIVPNETRTPTAQCRVLHARRGANLRAQRGTRFSFADLHDLAGTASVTECQGTLFFSFPLLPMMQWASCPLWCRHSEGDRFCAGWKPAPRRGWKPTPPMVVVFWDRSPVPHLPSC
jgi:hypothetical protein